MIDWRVMFHQWLINGKTLHLIFHVFICWKLLNLAAYKSVLNRLATGLYKINNNIACPRSLWTLMDGVWVHLSLSAEKHLDLWYANLTIGLKASTQKLGGERHWESIESFFLATIECRKRTLDFPWYSDFSIPNIFD